MVSSPSSQGYEAAQGFRAASQALLPDGGCQGGQLLKLHARHRAHGMSPYANDYRDIGVLKALADWHRIAVLLILPAQAQ